MKGTTAMFKLIYQQDEKDDVKTEILLESDSYDKVYDYLEDLLSADCDDGIDVVKNVMFDVGTSNIRRLTKMDNNSCYLICNE